MRRVNTVTFGTGLDFTLTPDPSSKTDQDPGSTRPLSLLVLNYSLVHIIMSTVTCRCSAAETKNIIGDMSVDSKI